MFHLPRELVSPEAHQVKAGQNQLHHLEYQQAHHAVRPICLSRSRRTARCVSCAQTVFGAC